MYWRWASESNPAWNGNSRALFQNNNSHRPTTASKSICSSDRPENFLKLTFQRRLAAQATRIRTIQNGQSLFTALNVRSPPAIELPGPGVFAAAASAALRQGEPANDASQDSSLRSFS